MLTFQVNDMTCGHCVRTLTTALQAADPGARVDIDLAAHRVQVQPAAADADTLRRAIEAAGYTPQLLADAPRQPTPAAPRRGCGCGGGGGGSGGGGCHAR